MVFDDGMKHDIDEYMAPSLAEQAEMHRRTVSPRGGTVSPRGGGGLSRQVSTSELSRQQSDGMDTVIIQRLQQWISESRDDLQCYFDRKDTRGRGLISPAEWREGLIAVLKLTNIPLVQYRAFHLPTLTPRRLPSSDKAVYVHASQNRGW